jgi:hypothetical protein
MTKTNRSPRISPKHTSPAARDFSREVLASLTRKGIAIIGSTWLPGEDGTFANGERGYVIEDRLTSRIRTYLRVIAIAS